MAKEAMIHARTEIELKKEVEKIFAALGLSTTAALNLFFHQVKMRRGLPFPVEIPNEATLKTFRDSDSGKGLVKSKSAKAIFRKLGI
ncbi:MAG: type II toxin-antitoxin system RelB/DinJ family antitoxin [Smithella sp.]